MKQHSNIYHSANLTNTLGTGLLVSMLILTATASLSLKTPDNYYRSYYCMDGETKIRGTNAKSKYNSLIFTHGKWKTGSETDIVAEWYPNLSSPGLVISRTCKVICRLMLVRDHTSLKFYKDGSVIFSRSKEFYSRGEDKANALKKLDAFQKKKGIAAIQKIGMMNVPFSDKWDNLKPLIDFHQDAVELIQTIPISNKMRTNVFKEVFTFMALCLYTKNTKRLKDYSEGLLEIVNWEKHESLFNEDLRSSLAHRVAASHENGSGQLNQIIESVRDIWQPDLQAVIEGYVLDKKYCMPDSPISRAFDVNPKIENYQELLTEIKKLPAFNRTLFDQKINNNEIFQKLATTLLHFYQQNWGALILNMCSSSQYWNSESRKNSNNQLWSYISSKNSFIYRVIDILAESLFGLMKDRVVKDHLDIVESLVAKGGFSLGDRKTQQEDPQFKILASKLKMFSYIAIDKTQDAGQLQTVSFNIFQVSRRNLRLL